MTTATVLSRRASGRYLGQPFPARPKSSNVTQTINGLNSLWGASIHPPSRIDHRLTFISRSHTAGSNSNLLGSISNFYSYIPFMGSTVLTSPSLTHSLFTLFTLPFRYLKSSIFSPVLPLHSIKPALALQEFAALNTPACVSSPPLPYHLFDLYIASGDSDEHWFNNAGLPTLQKLNVSFTKRQSHQEMDQFDPLYDMYARRRSRVLYYLINGKERLSQLTTELAFVIGERKHRIVVCLEYVTDEHTDSMLSACERRDLQRSRKYLEDLVRKEKITLSHSREESWQQALACCHSDDCLQRE